MVELGIVGVWPLCGSCVCVYVEADAERRRRDGLQCEEVRIVLRMIQ